MIRQIKKPMAQKAEEQKQKYSKALFLRCRTELRIQSLGFSVEEEQGRKGDLQWFQSRWHNPIQSPKGSVYMDPHLKDM